jgi:hypothetical protein
MIMTTVEVWRIERMAEEEERKRKAEERKQRILSKGASRLALVKGETVSDSLPELQLSSLLQGDFGGMRSRPYLS